MKKERQYKEPKYSVSPKTAKLIMTVFYVLRIILVIACIWGLILIFR